MCAKSVRSRMLAQMRLEAPAICSETQHTPSGAHHLLHEAFLADKADHSKCAGLVQFFDFLKLAGLHVCGIGAHCLVVTCCSEETDCLSADHGGLFREEGPW